MRRTLGVAGAGALVLLMMLASGSPARPGIGAAAGQTGTAEATATRAAEATEVADLRTRVADLSTQVARLEGVDPDALAGRLGGARSGFDAAYGRPISFVGDDQVSYQVPAVGRVTAIFEDGRAVRVVLSPDRPADKPTSESDAADWSLDRAQEIAAQFAPLDAELSDPERARPVRGQASSGQSPTLADGNGTPTASACPAVGRGSFTVAYTTPTRHSVSVVTLELVDGGGAPEPDEPLTRLAEAGGTRARSSLPSGLTNVNGVAVQGVQARLDAEGEQPPTAGSRYVAVELAIENRTTGDLAYQPDDFVLTDAEGRELGAVCGGVEPAITSGVLAPGESVAGWVSFLVPDDFAADEVTYLVGGSNGTLIIFTIR